MRRADLQSKIIQISKDPAVEKWLDGLKNSTKKTYLGSMATFCILTNKMPSELRQIAWEEQEARVPPWDQQLEVWFKQLDDYNNDPANNYSKTTVATRRTNISNFFHFYKIQTPIQSTRRNKTKLKVKNKREGLTKEDIKEAVNAAKSFKLKSLILTQATSGLALIDVLNLDVNQFHEGLIHLDKEHEICRIHQARSKTGREHYTFISYEAVDLIKKYLTLERKEPVTGPLFAASRKGNKRYSTESYRNAVNRLNNKLGWKNEVEEYNYGKLTTHMFRKFFETQLTNAGCITEHLMHMMGWKLPGMRAHYYLAHPEELQKSYIKHLDYLTLENVETITIESREVRELKESLQKELAERDEQTKPLLWLARVVEADPDLAEQFKKSAIKHNIK